MKPPRSGVIALPAAVLLWLAGCGSSGSVQSEDYGNILASPQGLVLVQAEHPTGWTRPDCFACHEIRNMHTVNRTGLPDCAAVPSDTPCVDLAQIQAVIRRGGEASCAQCHGLNGVVAPTPTATPVSE